MTCKAPEKEQLPQLLSLWKEAFGEWNGFWELFLNAAFSPGRCLCLAEGETVTAALTWLDCSCREEKIAYVYAVVTHPDHRGRGLCRTLLSETHTWLKALGYSSVLLVPADEALRQMYRKLGYETCTWVSEFSCEASNQPLSLRAIGPAEYAILRRQYLPEGGVIQEGESLTFLAAQAEFFAGKDFLLAAYREEASLSAMELLGNIEAAPGILQPLGCKKGSFRCPGDKKEFAMWHSLSDAAIPPKYFGFAFD